MTRSAAAPAALVRTVFGAQAARAEAFADLLRGPGVERGLLGPQEATRIWERHLFNCAAVAELLAPEERIVDVGTGAGLPGIPLALARPELSVDLVEPLARRGKFLVETVTALELTERVRVVRGRSEESAVRSAVGEAAVVVARAVAPLVRLVRWTLPLLAPGGRLLAMKGEHAEEEMATAARSVARLGGRIEGLRECPAAIGKPVRVVVVSAGEGAGGGRGRA